MTRVAVPDGMDERSLGHVLAGRARHRGGELVVGGRLLPEQREEVNRLATLVELGRDQRDADEVHRHLHATARVASPLRRTRREHVDRTLGLVVELGEAVGPGVVAHARPRARPGRAGPGAAGSRSSS